MTGGGDMQKKLRGMLPHGAILIANMFIVFFLIDRVNTAMNFIDNGLTKGLLLVMCLIVLCDALLPEKKTRRNAKRKETAATGGATPPVAASGHQPKHAAKSKGAGA